jgi:hypothetical protein
MAMVRNVLAGVTAATALSVAGAAPAYAASSPVRLYKVVYDPAGPDTHSNAQLNREYVVLKNTGRRTVRLTGWTVRDTKHHVYTFRGFSLRSGKYVYIHTGRGTDTSTNVYQGRGWYVWNNTGDTVFLRTSSGSTVDTCRWSRDGRGYVSC